MIKKFFFYSLILLAVSFYVTFYSANRGILPIDSFAFFDTGYLVSEGLHPLKDFWITTGILVKFDKLIVSLRLGPNLVPSLSISV